MAMHLVADVEALVLVAGDRVGEAALSPRKQLVEPGVVARRWCPTMTNMIFFFLAALLVGDLPQDKHCFARREFVKNDQCTTCGAVKSPSHGALSLLLRCFQRYCAFASSIKDGFDDATTTNTQLPIVAHYHRFAWIFENQVQRYTKHF